MSRRWVRAREGAPLAPGQLELEFDGCEDCARLGAMLCALCGQLLLDVEAASNPRPAGWTVEDARENGWAQT